MRLEKAIPRGRLVLACSAPSSGPFLLALPNGSAAARVPGAGVFLRLLDGSVWPVIPGTFARDRAYGIAQQVARAVGVGIKQVGHGWGA